ncbi:EAL domain-containing protein [Ferdinandcohnia quinoae]|uniref:EAL domain-containing protein n=1 Tax=Fredinandcohnia quinoae TaxID=2918902 RepID=A0AAW5ECI9_9BACI|nr:EAL domain-containing protein [Fredinandcohnia sp. SECRCQ15]MCH1627771.1 EAL domain-containing protein [Fredinandcohnia sp. SECRCQ15]
MTSLEKIIDEQLFFNEFQPIVSTETSCPEAYEAFIRTTPRVNPTDLFQYARDKDILYEIDITAIKNAINNFPIKFLRNHLLFVNVFPSTFINPKFIQFIKSFIIQRPFLQDKIVFELNEAECEKDYWLCYEFLMTIQELKSINLKIAIDDLVITDFWMQRIKEIQPNFIKIDQSYSRDLPKSQAEISFLLSMITGEAKVVLEGIEEEKEYILAKQLGIPLLQGYYFSKPKQL